MSVLTQKGNPAPYFLSYEVNEGKSAEVTASLGALQYSNVDKQRILDIEVRVGNYSLDNTHQIRGQRGGGGDSGRTASVLMPLDDDIDALKSVIWLETDRRYKAAVERMINVQANRAVRVEEEDSSGDLSREKSEKSVAAMKDASVDLAGWEKKVKAYSAMFKGFPELFDGQAGMTLSVNNQYFVNSEGTSVRHGTIQYRVYLVGRTQADDGMEFQRFESFDAHSLEGLPSEDAVRKTVEKIVKDLKALRTAPVIEPYTGPAILSGRASGVFFHEIFGHRIEGQRNKNESEGQTFARQVDKQILPTFISVVDDPTTEKIGSIDLNGYYTYDDEGVKGQRVAVVDKGILKTFLLDRAPVRTFVKSNGHGRAEPGYGPVSRQSNLIVESSRTVSDSALMNMLKDEARKQGKPFGLFFDNIEGGFTTTNRGSANAFNVLPNVVYRVYTDARPPELVRGVDLIGTPLAAFGKILATGDKPDVFNGICGAESGGVPVSASSPALLVAEVEVQKKAQSQEALPILAAPARIRKF